MYLFLIRDGMRRGKKKLFNIICKIFYPQYFFDWNKSLTAEIKKNPSLTSSVHINSRKKITSRRFIAAKDNFFFFDADEKNSQLFKVLDRIRRFFLLIKREFNDLIAQLQSINAEFIFFAGLPSRNKEKTQGCSWIKCNCTYIFYPWHFKFQLS